MIRDAVLTHLHIKNLRQHVDTEITFEEGKQLLLFSGQNGHGKTTIFEAISYALYGQPRKTTPRTTLDSMVRWGEELEGLYVELAFTMGNTNYVIKRRYVQGRSEATLSENGTLTTNSSGEVAKKVALLFALDAEGFRNAVVSEQQELAGLTSMDPTRRMKVISKITGITDMVNAAKAAKSDVAAMKKVIREIGPAPDVPAARQALALERETLDALTETQVELQSVVDSLAEELKASAHIDAEYRRRVELKATAEGALSSAKDNLSRSKRRLEQLQAQVEQSSKPEVTEPTAELIPRKEQISQELQDARAHNAKVAEREAITTRCDGLKRQHTVLSEEITDLRDDMSGVSEKMQSLSAASAKDLEAEWLEQNNALSAAKRIIADKRKYLTRLESLPAVCPECEQEVSDEHKQRHRDAAQSDIDNAEAAKAAATAEVERIADLREQVATRAMLSQRHESLQAEVAHRKASLDALQSELSDSFKTINDLPDKVKDTNTLEDALTGINARLHTALEQQEAVHAYERLLDSVQAAQAQVASAQEAVDAQQGKVEELVIPDTLIAQVEEWQEASKRFAAEKDLLHETSLDVVAAQGRINTAEQHLQRTESDEERRNQLLTSLEVSSATERLLDTAAKRAAAQLRPALEGSLSNLLSTMSGGLYTEAQLSVDYSVSVVKAGELRALNSFSGGEKDLIGLALRLALAQTVAARNSGTGPGFLILDEILGSQDSKRQATIFEALRSMKDLYPQVFIISHTSGSEDLADAVYETTAAVDGAEGEPLAASVVAYA